MKVKLCYGSVEEDEDASQIVFVHHSDAHGPHIRSVPDEHGAHVMLFFTRDEILVMKDWCEAVLRRQG